MTGPILILSGPQEGPYLRDALLMFDPDLHVDLVQDRAQLMEVSARSTYADGLDARLIAFCTDVIVPTGILCLFKAGAYNFHPGPPAYPGSHAASFAIYDGAETYGVTAHVMEAQVDTGAIVGVEDFDIPPNCRFMELEALAYSSLLVLFNRLVPDLAATDKPLAPLALAWGRVKHTRREFEAMKKVTDGMSEAEIRLRWRAFG